MVHFRDISIRRKLLLINMLTTSTALMLASTAFISYERQRFQEDLGVQLNAVADVLGAKAGVALAAGDKAAANEVLREVAVEPRILAACLYRANGQVLSCYSRQTVAADYPHAVTSPRMQSLDGERLLSRPILAQGRTLGSMWICFDSRVPFETLRHETSM